MSSIKMTHYRKSMYVGEYVGEVDMRVYNLAIFRLESVPNTGS